MNRQRDKNEPNNRERSFGFTVIELIIALVVFAVFGYGLFESFFLLQSQSTLADRQARANDIAFTNLSKVISRPAALTQAVCTANAATMDLTTGTPSTKPGLDITQYGYTLESSASARQALGSDATQALVAYAPSGCTNFSTNPVEIVAKVTFGGTTVAHAEYLQ